MTLAGETLALALDEASCPPLREGDRLSSSDFEARYTAMPEVHKAELIDGVVFMPSPVRARSHSEPHQKLIVWAGLYAQRTPGLFCGPDVTLRLDDANQFQPDVCLMRVPEVGGQARFSPDDYIEGAPEWVAEVSASTSPRDTHLKQRTYLRCGVREYVIWRVDDAEPDWFVRTDGRYVRLSPDPAGVLRSTQFPGLWLHLPAILGGDFEGVLKTLDEGLHSAAYREFAAGLAQRGA